MRRISASATGPIRVLAGLLAIGICLGAIAVAEGPGRYTTYAGRSGAVAVVAAVTGLTLVAAGIATTLDRRRGPVGWLAIFAGLTWFAPTWIAWQNGPPLVPSVAMVLAGFTFAFVFHLVLAYPGGLTRPTLLRVAVWLVYVETFVAALGLAVFRDPYFDPGCLSNCNVNVFLVRSSPSLAQTIIEADRWFVTAATLVLVGTCLARLATGSRPARRELAPVVLPGAFFGAAAGVRAVELRRSTVEDPFNGVLFATFILAGIALTLLAAGLIVAVVRMWLQRRALLRITMDLDEGPAPGTVRAALADALGDPQLVVAYPLANRARYVDSDGRPIAEPVADGGQTVTTLVKGDRTIAIVSHAPTITDLGSQIGPAVLLALENERLQAELLAELEELRDSRMRIVETGDAERRRLERDLHDGAQQRLLALSYDIRLAKAAAESEGDVAAGSLLTRAIEETRGALEDLRDIAHGIYPAVLEEAGLGPALETLADAASATVVIRVDDRRYPAAVEAAAYFAAAETLDDATGRGAQQVTISCGVQQGRLILTVEDDGSERASPMMVVTDRVGALDGEATFGATTCRVEILCE